MSNRTENTTGLKGGVTEVSPNTDLAVYDLLPPEFQKLLQETPLDVRAEDVYRYVTYYGVETALRELTKLVQTDFPGYAPPRPRRKLRRVGGERYMIRQRHV
jgi:hypothetical protein